MLGRVPKSYNCSVSGRVHGYNAGPPEIEWFDKFIVNNIKNDKVYNFIGIFGSKMFPKRNRFPHSFFYSGETVHTGKPFLEYNDYLLDRVDLSMTFDRIDAPNYLRFPQWILWCFSPVLDKDYIKKQVDDMNAARNTGRYEAVIVSNHDGHKTRQPICDALSDMLDIKYAGKWRNNTDALWKEYDNDKIKYVHEFKFNICPENRNVKDYVTEKLFEAFAAGAIPIYYGSENKPEPGIINPDAILFWDVKHKERNAEVYERIRELNSNSKLYDEFISQSKLTDYTVDYIYDTMNELKRRLNDI